MRFARSRLAPALLAILLLPLSQPLFAATGETVGSSGTITIEQTGPEDGVLSEWTLIQPGNVRTVLQKPTYTFEEMPAGSYTLIAQPPDGAAGTLELTVNGVPSKSAEVPQVSFTLGEGEAARVALTFTYTQVGVVSVNTDPSGLAFTLSGPNGIVREGATPASYLNYPIGLYSVTLHKIEGCVTPKPRSQRLVKAGRANLDFVMVCEAITERAEVIEEKKLQYAAVTVDGMELVFQDVPIDAWFAPFIAAVAKTGIISGYRDEQGNLTGIYGPGNQVTVAELLKIAHEVAGVDEKDVVGQPQNPRALRTWFSEYYASAERRSWVLTFDRRLDPARPATRAEVVTTILQALEVPRLWAKGEMFADVPPTMKYADAIETAATDGLIAGYTDESGKPTGNFGPEDPIDRASMAKIVSRAIELYIEDSPEITGESQ